MGIGASIRAAASLVVMAAIAGCAAAGTTPAGTATSSVAVDLREWAIGSDPTSVPAGRIEFVASNAGPEWDHELVVVKTDLPLDALPTKSGGSVDEEGPGIETIGEVASVAPGGTGSVTLDLVPGKYVLICNLIEDIRVHYELGMRSPFEVTP
jgi:uncharacterized cupredoxin-like copper-binding protein